MIFEKEDLDICTKFSEEVDTSFYSKRNQFDNTKRKADTKIGKLGELAVYYHFKDKNISYPDFKIYSAKEKSWDYDLKTKNENIHVKSQETLQGAKYGISWIFQLEDKHIKNYNDNDYVAFVSVNLLNKSAEIKSIMSVKSLHEKQLFKKPILNKLNSKSAVYFEDLKDLPFEL